MSWRDSYTPVRRGHIIAPIGPGAITLTRERVSAVICAPPTWMLSSPKRPAGAVSVLDELTISDRQLQSACRVNRFIQPWPMSDEPRKEWDWYIPAARFPLAEYCANPSCQQLVIRHLADAKEGHCDSCTPRGKRGQWPTFQVPVVLACQNGHLADVPWQDWLHGTRDATCARPDLRYQPGADATRPTLTCKGCGLNKKFSPDVRIPCPGERPWLPHADRESCAEEARPLERTSTAVYYPFQLSSVTIPPAGLDNAPLARALSDNPVLRALRKVPRTGEVVQQMVIACAQIGISTNPAEVQRHLEAIENPPVTGTPRSDELDALTSHNHPRRRGTMPDLVVIPQDIAGYRDCRMGDLLSAVSLIPRLRETRVLAGFSRVEPASVTADIGYRQLWGKQRPHEFSKSAEDDWLPGYEVYGEGILIVLEPTAVQAWARRAAESSRVQAQARHAIAHGGDAFRLPWLLAHTLAHLVMRAAAPHAGYPLPSLRERIYTIDERTAFLVYTAAGDVRGTLGGLVELGESTRLPTLLDAAIDSADWCATDPVCIEDGSLHSRGSWPGACHHCLLVPETSCEAFNRGLDRAVIHGSPSAPGWLA